jgi:hypothetical protein
MLFGGGSSTGASHPHLSCYLGPTQALITQLQDLLCRGRVGPRTATHTDARAMKLIVDRGPMNAAPHRSGVGSSSARTCRLPAECPLRHRNRDPTTRLQKDPGLVRQRDTPRQCSLVVQAWSAQGNAEGNEVAGDKLLGTSRSPRRLVHIPRGLWCRMTGAGDAQRY